MAFGEGSFRSRAASLLHPGSPLISRSFGWEPHASSEPTFDEKGSQNETEKDEAVSSGEQTYHSSGRNAVAHNKEAQRVVRTIPGGFTS